MQIIVTIGGKFSRRVEIDKTRNDPTVTPTRLIIPGISTVSLRTIDRVQPSKGIRNEVSAREVGIFY